MSPLGRELAAKGGAMIALVAIALVALVLITATVVHPCTVVSAVETRVPGASSVFLTVLKDEVTGAVYTSQLDSDWLRAKDHKRVSASVRKRATPMLVGILGPLDE